MRLELRSLKRPPARHGMMRNMHVAIPAFGNAHRVTQALYFLLQIGPYRIVVLYMRCNRHKPFLCIPL